MKKIIFIIGSVLLAGYMRTGLGRKN